MRSITVIGNEWDNILSEEYRKKYFLKLVKFVNSEYENKTIFPKKSDIFNALKMTKYNDIKVVILGQDPYHGLGEAQGLAFSVPENIKMPPSLRNIFKELDNDLSIKRSKHSLEDWANQGVLLLNTILTVEKDKPLSHQNKGWEIFTDKVINKINDLNRPVIFVLWGASARNKKVLIDQRKHYIIESAHPSPLSASRGFFGSKPFSKINEILKKNNIEGIKW